MNWGMKNVVAAVGGMLFVGIFVGSSATGCDKPEPCTEYCRKQLTCIPPSPPDTNAIPACITTCQDTAAKDAAFQQAIQQKASCYWSTNCADIQMGTCDNPT